MVLDGGLGTALFDFFRPTLGRDDIPDRLYMFIVLGALVMRVGGFIESPDLELLRDAVDECHCNEGAAPGMDWHFRGPGRRQIINALDNYVHGVPRSFEEAR